MPTFAWGNQPICVVRYSPKSMGTSVSQKLAMLRHQKGDIARVRAWGCVRHSETTGGGDNLIYSVFNLTRKLIEEAVVNII